MFINLEVSTDDSTISTVYIQQRFALVHYTIINSCFAVSPSSNSTSDTADNNIIVSVGVLLATLIIITTYIMMSLAVAT